ncbi:MAG: translation initiation factor eIF-2B [Candidatus Eisenbacteria bacterium]|nr:translation initiation factor eIF-2B [Candidatus Eisenbacteria bacterium]
MNRPGKDRISGASEITLDSIRFFADLIKNSKADTCEALSKELIHSARELAAREPSFASLLNLASMVVHKSALLTRESASLDEARIHLLAFLDDNTKTAELSARKITALASDLISDGMVISTFSRSSLVERSLIKAREEGKRVRVVLSEGRPVFEGILLAKKLSNSGIDTILVTDSVLPVFLSRSDILLIGCDAVTERSFINKAGTYPICLVAREHNVPVYCLCETSKFISARTPLLRIEERDPGEIVNFALPNVSVKNICFEEIPLKLVKAFLTESGYLSPDEASFLAEAVELAEELES